MLNFNGPLNGGYPLGGPIMDAKGDLFGTAYHGGQCNCGVVWELAPSAAFPGHWTETIIHQFRNTGVLAEQGFQPSAGLALGPGGSLYGTTAYGAGPANCVFPCADGVVFRLIPLPDGTWQYQVLHVFTGVPDGANPVAAVTLEPKARFSAPPTPAESRAAIVRPAAAPSLNSPRRLLAVARGPKRCLLRPPTLPKASNQWGLSPSEWTKPSTAQPSPAVLAPARFSVSVPIPLERRRKAA